ncbi:aldolase [Coniochaeta ligniaria NRRL 30616]|uniref:Transaldolase n=1 Tax=Coniochaeta ligniaria NRRL 30616 TaxID=1408157 RepID=A0A1J7IL82_9PEZI|nr:aldolase [Coniochaeta ligniaria NRRL 30616]
MASNTLLEHLRSLTSVACDTLDVKVAEHLGPFTDCTSNQAIAFHELSKVDGNGKSVYEDVIKKSLTGAHWMFPKQADATVEELAVELMMVQLSLGFAPHTTGYLHVQTNPKWSYSTDKTVKNAKRILAHFRHIAPDFDIKRVCIKIPATWEGLQACRELEMHGIATLATTMFCMEQAVLAAQVGCTYIAPYVNELRVHFDPSYHDSDKGLTFCFQAQHYFETQGCKTKVLAASLTSIEEVMQLAGVHHITISPPLLAELAATTADGWKDRDVLGRELNHASEAIPLDESAWRMAFTRSKAGKNEGKIIQAINIFADMQDQLENMARKFQARA